MTTDEENSIDRGKKYIKIIKQANERDQKVIQI